MSIAWDVRKVDGKITVVGKNQAVKLMLRSKRNLGIFNRLMQQILGRRRKLRQLSF